MKRGVATYTTFITSCRLPLTILFICNKSGWFFNDEKTMYYRKSKIIVAIINYISCYMFPFIKFRMYVLKCTYFFVKILYNFF